MLPPTLFSAYRQYKKDTDFVASWLASTAKASGYQADLLTTSTVDPSKPPSKRLKGKARSDARKTANAPTDFSNSLPTSAPKYTVATKDFILLAEYIASRKPAVSVPLSFSTIIDRVIEARSAFSRQIAEHTRTEAHDPAPEQRHRYFVGVLERVREVLKPRMSSTAFVKTASGRDQTYRPVNVFDALKVYDPAEIDEPLPFATPPVEPSRASEALYQAEPQVSVDDAWMAYAMMVTDLAKIRSTIRSIWSDYRDMGLDLAAAAIATNAAVDLARNLIEEVLPVLKHHGLWQLVSAFCFAAGFDRADSIGEILSEGFAYEVEDELYMGASRIIGALRIEFQPGELPVYKARLFGIYDPEQDRMAMTDQEKFAEDKAVLAEILPEIMMINRYMIKDYPVQDEFVRGLDEMDRTDEIPFYLVFAAQVFLDIHHTLRADAERPFHDLMVHVSKMGSNIDDHLHYHEDLKTNAWSADNDKDIRNLRGRMKMLELDPVYLFKMQVWRSCTTEMAPPSGPPNRILRLSPLLAGLWLYHFREQMYEISIDVANAWRSITYTWQLYNALETQKLTHGDWKDMQVVEALIGDENFHVGHKPTNPASYFTQCCLQRGVSAAIFTGNRRRDIDPQSKAGARTIKYGATVSRLFKDRYVNNIQHFDWNSELLHAFLSQSDWDLQAMHDPRAENDGTYMDRADVGRTKDNRKAAKNRSSKRPCLQPSSLIWTLAQALQAERAEIAYPYLAMHKLCWEVLRDVKAVVDPMLRAKYPSGYVTLMKRESELPWIVWYIFLAASGADHGQRDMQPLVAAAGPLNQRIEHESDVLVRCFSEWTGISIEFEEEEEEGVEGR